MIAPLMMKVRCSSRVTQLEKTQQGNMPIYHLMNCNSKDFLIHSEAVALTNQNVTPPGL